MPTDQTSADDRSLAVSVLIPTYNGQRFLGVVLESLARQTLAGDSFEIIIVDNNSTVDLFATEAAIQARKHLAERGIRLTVVNETRQGLTHARSAGIHAARAAIAVFLDDDNEVVPDYLESGIAAFADATVGMLISRVSPDYYEQPSPAVRRREHLLAINYQMGDEPKRWDPSIPISPTLGAGLWIRTAVFRTIQQDFKPIMSDRVQDQLVSGGDIELGIFCGRLGLTRLYLPSLGVHHHLPESRVQPAYIVRLIQGIIRSEMTLQSHYFGRRYSLMTRLGKLVLNSTVGVFVALRRGDAGREYRFIVASALAQFRGPLKL
ncbi:hypothetical protein BH11PLA2_BH11PLA2_12750 [soil metagenome]